MLSQHDEILIQRCVDNECTAEERRQLIARLDELPDGWKSLACTYMEEQLFAAACIADSRAGAAAVVTAEPPALPKPHWFHRPAVSMVLTACVMFLIGVLVSGGLGDRTNNEIASPSDARPLIQPNEEAIVNSVPARSAPAYQVQYEADGASSRTFPVYNDVSEFLSEYQQFQNADFGSLPVGQHSASRIPVEIRLLRFPADDGHSYVIPVQEFQISPRFQ